MDQTADYHFPVAGMDLSRAYADQRPRDLGDGTYARTTRGGLNARGYETSRLRRRGGSRPGLDRYNPAPVVADWVVQELNLIAGEGFAPPGGHVQLSQSGRTVTLVAVSKGDVYTAQPGDTSWTVAANGTRGPHTPPLNYSGVLQSTALNQKLWFADGVNWCYYDPSLNKVLTWDASAGVLPVDSAGNAPRLICTWRGRVVLSGLLFSPQDWFMSAATDPTNFDYAPFAPTPTQAIAGDNAPLGVVGDVITTLIPYTDDVLIFGGDHTIYMMSGDPMAGGQIDLVSSSVGMAWGIPWCMDPYGTIYFVSNKCGVYSLVPGEKPQRISQQIELLLQDLDTGSNQFRLFWNDRHQGFHVFISPIIRPAATTHLFWEQRTGAWWTDQLASTSYDPLCGVVFDGNTPGDRQVLIGSWDGYVRSVSPTGTTDDGLPFPSSVLIGPFNTNDLDELLLKDLQAVLGETSGPVAYAVYVGKTAEAALTALPVATGTWLAGRNPNTHVRRSAHALYVKLSATSGWSMEQIRARFQSQGKVARRRVF